jgi:4-hydroxy 2-oxovalerate aldolase
MNIIDVTLRDGGHLMDFNWDLNFTREYYNLLSSFNSVDTIELGYWKQTSKSKNDYYNLDMEKIYRVTDKQGYNNISIMIDYHYCTHDVTEYPTNDEQNEVSMIRLCARKEDINEALIFGEKLKEYTKLNVSFNVFNASNYTKAELDNIADIVSESTLDYVYFADTHGAMDVKKEFNKFENIVNTLKRNGKKVGFHLHDHSGKGYYNFMNLSDLGFESSDTSVRGMGKGSGNLRLEYITENEELTKLASLINKYDFLKTNPNAYELITAKYSLTDNYAKEALANDIRVEDFDRFCSKIEGLDRDTYNSKLLNDFINE